MFGSAQMKTAEEHAASAAERARLQQRAAELTGRLEAAQAAAADERACADTQTQELQQQVQDARSEAAVARATLAKGEEVCCRRMRDAAAGKHGLISFGCCLYTSSRAVSGSLVETGNRAG